MFDHICFAIPHITKDTYSWIRDVLGIVVCYCCLILKIQILNMHNIAINFIILYYLLIN
jgi:hypothetical protein